MRDPKRSSGLERLAEDTSRRGFLARVSGVLMSAAGAQAAVGVVTADAAATYTNFCGHTYTTGNCPHPTGLPRIDRQGMPLRAKDGHRVDDLGRPVDTKGRPLTPAGRLLRDADGEPLAPAPRTQVCAAVAQRYGIRTYNDGAWYRCCGGQVRKLVDCCSPHPKRINGDAGLGGYCYKGRKVFCVQYRDTNVPC
ncbi:hypothetical protein DSM112329_01844 [Paraconexibacter sp. AEG42_29]|uniref:Twin-arginine translocation signal domain-containing protein n=1 Tax=Paraconexibacter sp. AEG42_29 TaxID=2997339 RepID=A0AAU7ATL5_9ACTN